MKIPLVVTIFVVAAAAGLGWHNHQRLATLRAVRDQLTDGQMPCGVGIRSLR